jgi:hypothetical protein
MSRKKDEERKREAAADWLAMTPRDHLDQAADIWGTIIGTPGGVGDRLTALAHAQTHLLAGLLKLKVAESRAERIGPKA